MVVRSIWNLQPQRIAGHLMWGINAAPPVNGTTGWGRQIASGSGIPLDASGNLGDRYYDITASRWYLKRWVGNFSGIDTIVGPAILGVVQNQEFSMECMLKADPSITIYRHVVSNAASTIAGMLNIGINSPATSFGSDHYGFEGPIITSSLDVWHKLEYTGMHNGTSWVETVTVDGVSNSKTAVGAFSVGTTTLVGGLATSVRAWLGKICNVRLSGNGKILNWKIDEGSGIAISDASGNGNNGTLTDGAPTDFWYQAWVPMDLL